MLINARYTEIHQKFNFENIRDLICILIDLIPNYGAIHHRIISVIIYLMLRLLLFRFEECRDILSTLELMDISTCHSWANTIKDEDDICVILRDGRKGPKRNFFYDEFPDIEEKAKAYAKEKGSTKKCNFTVHELAIYVDKIFRETYNETLENFGYETKNLIRSIESCRVDLLKWGAKFEKNSNHPYFEGHERADVVKKRKEFCEYFSQFKDQYFYPFYDQNNNLTWNSPLRRIRILLSHDESTYKSGEVSMFRWLFPNMAQFFNKGRGRSIMVSQFHNTTDIFKLSESEWERAVADHPELEKEDEILNYYPRSANAWIEPKKDNYFDNKVILRQFERLFILLKYKEDFKDFEFEILIDNARTHRAKTYDAMINESTRM